MKNLKSKIKAVTIGVILLIVVIITMKPFYHWCEGVYADACYIMEIIKNREDDYSLMDTQIEEDNSAKKEDIPKYINRYNPNAEK